MHIGSRAKTGLAAVSVFCFASVSSADAEWIYKKEEKAFGETEAIAMAMGESSIVFISCSSEGLKLSLATPEDYSSGGSTLNLLSPKIIVSVDGAKPVRFETSLEENGLHKVVAVTDDEDIAREAATQIAAARKRIDIGVELAGKKFHTSKLSAVGVKKSRPCWISVLPKLNPTMVATTTIKRPMKSRPENELNL
ncbi:hypothetical protein Hden_2837 [Hyphomicrobium denitrificans ATCC 51888]|uniref:Uncharacterized protein n=1 Tax=Hyphomicrobium denitrificans (strain ATCC 51888 / DSM 1869 / NCIMB 11706 / TK 0415) TaxID=582899 RepID=D8JUK3_HYPDA|nr:hypothetical protein [Hyphomicrobium denitrificans]ADJ24633.1 hypothetical protein Hden_2837 [Hyphomicrobium denitrificans ATCC 51888]